MRSAKTIPGGTQWKKDYLPTQSDIAFPLGEGAECNEAEEGSALKFLAMQNNELPYPLSPLRGTFPQGESKFRTGMVNYLWAETMPGDATAA